MILQSDEIKFIRHGVQICRNILNVITHTRARIQHEHDVYFVQLPCADDVISDAFESFGEWISEALTTAFRGVVAVTFSDRPNFRNPRRFKPVKSATTLALNTLP